MEATNALAKLLQALAKAFSLERHVFVKYFDTENSVINVRVNYYPPCPRPKLSLGLTPQSDAISLTLFMQFDATGVLQVLKDQKWLTLPCPSHALLVNMGDLLEIMSNGRLKSLGWGIYRVVKQDVDWFSVAFFYNPPSTVEIEPDCQSLLRTLPWKTVVSGRWWLVIMLSITIKLAPQKRSKPSCMLRVKFNEMGTCELSLDLQSVLCLLI